jgi:hypothetical protein
MIQRIQTVYFLIAAIILAVFSTGISIISYTGNDISYVLTSSQLITKTAGNELAESSSQYFFFGSILLAVWTLFVIISFRNLKRQLAVARIGLLAYFGYLLIILLTFFIGNSLTENPTVAEFTPSYNWGTYLLIIGFVVYYLGVNGIKKDKKLIDSVDRIR